MRYRYLVDFRRGISVFAIFSYGIAVLGTPQCPPPDYQAFMRGTREVRSEKEKQRKETNFGDCVLSNHCHIKILDMSQDSLNVFVTGLSLSLSLFPLYLPSPSKISSPLAPKEDLILRLLRAQTAAVKKVGSVN